MPAFASERDYEQAYFCLCGAYPNGGKPIVQYPQKSGLLVVDELLIPCSQTNSLDLYLLGSWAGGWQTEYFYDWLRKVPRAEYLEVRGVSNGLQIRYATGERIGAVKPMHTIQKPIRNISFEGFVNFVSNPENYTRLSKPAPKQGILF